MLPSTLKLDSGTSCATASPVETAVASAVVPTKPLSPATSGAATSNPDPVKPSVPRSVMCGARKPRLALTTNDQSSAAVKIAPARNVVLVVENESSGQS